MVLAPRRQFKNLFPLAGLLPLLLAAGIALAQSQGDWVYPEADNAAYMGYPTQDCGHNYFFGMTYPGKKAEDCLALRGAVSEKAVNEVAKDIEARRAELGDAPYHFTPLESALYYFERLFLGIK